MHPSPSAETSRFPSLRFSIVSSLNRPPILADEAPNPPSPDETDQHAVVTMNITLCACDFAGLHLDTGFEPVGAAPRTTEAFARYQLTQLAGLCSPLFLSDYLLTGYSTNSVCQLNS